jgi:hypothetical protein
MSRSPVETTEEVDVALEKTDMVTWTPRPRTVSTVGEELRRAETRR